MIFLTVQLVEGIHAAMIERYGGSPGLRDRGLLESAVARAENKANYDPEASVAEVGASLAYGLIKNHAFIDGNKRVGLGSMAAFLELNQFRLSSPEDDQIAMVWKAAANEVTEEEWTVWVMRNVSPHGHA